MEIRLTIEQKQQLSQKAIQNIEILQMNGQQLDSYLEKILLENPVIDPDASYSSDSERLDSFISYDESEITDWHVSSGNADGEKYLKSEPFTMQQRIFLQVLPHTTSMHEKEILRYLVHSLDDNGYLSCSIEDAASACHVSKKVVSRCLGYLQMAEPPGIGARNVKECLELQILVSDWTEAERDISLVLIRNWLQELADHKIRQIVKETGLSEKSIMNAIEKIRTLNPKPLNGYYSEHTEYIRPDVIIEDTEDGFRVQFYGNSINHLAMVSNYSDMYAASNTEVQKYLQEHFQSAMWINSCLEQRRITMILVVEQLLLTQQDFFLKGPAYLKPLLQCDLA